MLKSVYSKPKLCKSKSGWYVHFRFNNRQKRYKLGLNLIENEKEREQEFNVLAKVLEKKLKNGWNPFDDISPEEDSFRLVEALDFALKKKKNVIAPKTYSGYKGTVTFIKAAISALCIDYLEVKNVKRSHIRTIIEKAKEQRKWSNKSHNKNLNYLSAIMDELLHWDIIEVNPVTKIRRLPEEESISNRTPTEKEHKIIKCELKTNHSYFYNFIETEFHTGIRPKEILSIQLNMIDLENREIHLPPKITKSGTKKRNVVINNHLYKMLSDMELSMNPQNFYLFGSYREKGRGNVGKHLDFIPGPTPIKRDTATKRWKRIVKDKLGIDVNMYAYKHKGADDKLLAGVELDSIRNQLGHTTKKMTTTYAKGITGVYKKDIIDNSPEF